MPMDSQVAPGSRVVRPKRRTGGVGFGGDDEVVVVFAFAFRAGVAEGAGGGGAGVGGEIGDDGVVVGDLEAAAAWLLEEVELERGAGSVEGDELAGSAGGDGDAVHAEEGIAEVGEVGAEGLPAAGLGALGAEDAIAGEGMAGVAEADGAVAELALQDAAGLAGEHIGGGVGVAELEDADGGGGGVLLVLGEGGEEAVEGGGEGDGGVAAGESGGDGADGVEAGDGVDVNEVAGLEAGLAAPGCGEFLCGGRGAGAVRDRLS